MRRADRLFQIIQLLRGRRTAVTARFLAEQLEISERTVYRDIRDLVASGTPIEGEAGVGYTLRAGYDLPPLMFDAQELEALVLGARVVAGFGDEELARAARRVLSKVEAVLPKAMRPKLEEPALYVPRLPRAEVSGPVLAAIRQAIAERSKLRVRYATGDGDESERVIHPLGAFFWGTSWTVTAWCELRESFRNFRLDRMAHLEPTGETFDVDESRTLDAYLRSMGYPPKDAL